MRRRRGVGCARLGSLLASHRPDAIRFRAGEGDKCGGYEIEGAAYVGYGTGPAIPVVDPAPWRPGHDGVGEVDESAVAGSVRVRRLLSERPAKRALVADGVYRRRPYALKDIASCGPDFPFCLKTRDKAVSVPYNQVVAVVGSVGGKDAAWMTYWVGLQGC
jgi:hypothetical protein